MAIESVTKKEIINAVQANLTEQGIDLSKADVEKVMSAYTDTLMGAAVYGQRASLGEIGSFTPVVKAARKARNPQTGEEIQVEEKVAIRFSLSKRFGEMLNDDEVKARIQQ